MDHEQGLPRHASTPQALVEEGRIGELPVDTPAQHVPAVDAPDHFVEADRRAAAVISRNIAELGVDGAVVRCATASSVAATSATRPVDLVFADPPYDVPATEVEAVVAQLVSCGWLADGAIAVIERPTSGPALAWPDGWTVLRERRYGDTRLEMAEWTAGQSG